MAIDTRARQAIALDFERKPFYSPAEVAHILGISDETVRKRIEDQTLYAVHVGPRLLRIPLAALMLFLGEPARVRRSRDPRARIDALTDDLPDLAEHTEPR